MQEKMQVFENHEFGQLGVLMIDGKPYFPASECAGILGYANTKAAILRHCRWVTKRDLPHPQNPNKTLEVNFIPEGDLYRLIIRSKLPAVEIFEKWVFDEVLPSIRSYGAYINEEVLRRMQEDSEFTAELLRNLTAEQKRNNVLVCRVAHLTPKAQYHDIILQCSDAVQVSIIAKDYGMTAVAFNKLLNRLRVQFRIGKTWLLYKDYQGLGYTVTNTYTKNGITSFIHTCWTPKGRYWLYELLKSFGILPEAERARQMSLDDMSA